MVPSISAPRSLGEEALAADSWRGRSSATGSPVVRIDDDVERAGAAARDARRRDGRARSPAWTSAIGCRACRCEGN